jgi:exonuclease III
MIAKMKEMAHDVVLLQETNLSRKQDGEVAGREDGATNGGQGIESFYVQSQESPQRGGVAVWIRKPLCGELFREYASQPVQEAWVVVTVAPKAHVLVGNCYWNGNFTVEEWKREAGAAVERWSEIMEEWQGPVLIGGDFNCRNLAPFLKRLKEMGIWKSHQKSWPVPKVQRRAGYSTMSVRGKLLLKLMKKNGLNFARNSGLSSTFFRLSQGYESCLDYFLTRDDVSPAMNLSAVVTELDVGVDQYHLPIVVTARFEAALPHSFPRVKPRRFINKRGLRGNRGSAFIVGLAPVLKEWERLNPIAEEKDADPALRELAGTIMKFAEEELGTYEVRPRAQRWTAWYNPALKKKRAVLMEMTRKIHREMKRRNRVQRPLMREQVSEEILRQVVFDLMRRDRMTAVREYRCALKTAHRKFCRKQWDKLTSVGRKKTPGDRPPRATSALYRMLRLKRGAGKATRSAIRPPEDALVARLAKSAGGNLAGLVPGSEEANMFKEINECVDRAMAGESTPEEEARRAASCPLYRENRQNFKMLVAEVFPPEVFDAIQVMALNKASGLNGVVIDLLKSAARWVRNGFHRQRPEPQSAAGIVLQVLATLFTKLLKLELWPSVWKEALVVFIYKNRGKRNDAKNYRALAMVCHIAKILEVIQHKRNEFLDASLHDAQFGFRQEVGVYECILVQQAALWNFINVDPWTGNLYSPEERRYAILVFQDMAAAYDSFPHAVLLKRYAELGAPPNVLRFLKSILSGRSAQVPRQGGTAIRVDLDKGCGVGQGSVDSPLNFGVYVNPLLVTSFKFFLKQLKARMQLMTDIRVYGSKKKSANIAAFADDVETQFSSTEMANTYYASKGEAGAVSSEWAVANGCRWNLGKYKAQVMGKMAKSEYEKYPLKIGERVMEYPTEDVVNLGHVFPCDYKKLMCFSMIPASLNTVACLTASHSASEVTSMSTLVILQTLKTVVWQQVLYRAATSLRFRWHFTAVVAAEKLQRKCLRRAFSAYNLTRTHRLYLETGIFPIEYHIVVRQLCMLKKQFLGKSVSARLTARAVLGKTLYPPVSSGRALSDVEAKREGTLEYDVLQLFRFCNRPADDSVAQKVYNMVKKPVVECDKEDFKEIVKDLLREKLFEELKAKEGRECEGWMTRPLEEGGFVGKLKFGQEAYVKHGRWDAKYGFVWRVNRFNAPSFPGRPAHVYPCVMCHATAADDPHHFMSTCTDSEIVRLRDLFKKESAMINGLKFDISACDQDDSTHRTRIGALKKSLKILRKIYEARHRALPRGSAARFNFREPF